MQGSVREEGCRLRRANNLWRFRFGFLFLQVSSRGYFLSYSMLFLAQLLLCSRLLSTRCHLLFTCYLFCALFLPHLDFSASPWNFIFLRVCRYPFVHWSVGCWCSVEGGAIREKTNPQRSDCSIIRKPFAQFNSFYPDPRLRDTVVLVHLIFLHVSLSLDRRATPHTHV